MFGNLFSFIYCFDVKGNLSLHPLIYVRFSNPRAHVIIAFPTRARAQYVSDIMANISISGNVNITNKLNTSVYFEYDSA